MAIENSKGPAYWRNDSSILCDLIMTKPTFIVDKKFLMEYGILIWFNNKGYVIKVE